MSDSSFYTMLNSWERRVLKAIDAHYASERFYRSLNTKLGVPTVILAAIISALSFSFIGRTISIWVQILVGFLGVIQIVLTSLHTWFKYSELAEKHHRAGTDYAAIRRYIEQLKNVPSLNVEESINEVRKQLHEIAKEVPTVPGSIWKNTQIAYGGHGTADGVILNADEK